MFKKIYKKLNACVVIFLHWSSEKYTGSNINYIKLISVLFTNSIQCFYKTMHNAVIFDEF